MTPEDGERGELAPEAPIRTVDQMARVLLKALQETAEYLPEEFDNDSKRVWLEPRKVTTYKNFIHQAVARELARRAEEGQEELPRVKVPGGKGVAVNPLAYPGDVQKILLASVAEAMTRGSYKLARLSPKFADALVRQIALRVEDAEA